MADELRLLPPLVVASVAAYALTPVAIRAAAHYNFYDTPGGYKGHAKSTPYLGGCAVLGAFLVALLLLAGDTGRTLPVVAGVAVLWAVGTIDDRRTVSPVLRVLIELALAAMIWATGLGWELGLGAGADLVATCFWVVAVVNAFNLFDNMDGASSVTASVVGAAVAILGVIEGDVWLATAGAALAGACLGFLPYNLARPRAQIFLGDGGSMPLGFAVAALVMIGATEAVAGADALVVGLLLVGVPAMDTALVCISRRRKGISVLTGGRDHLTHRAQRRLGTSRAVAVSLGAVQAIVAAVALVALGLGPAAVITATVFGLAIAGAIITMIEREEDRLLAAGEVSVPEAALEQARAQRAKRPDPATIGDAALLALALGASLSPLAFGYYGSGTWVPIGLALLLVVTMGAIRRPQRLPLQAWLVLGGLTGIGLLALLSARWAASADQAVVSGNRWLVLAVVLGLGLVLLRSTRRDVLAVAGLAAGTLVVAAIVVIRMLGDDPAAVFLGGRLHEPLGYINAEATVFLMGVWLCFAAAERREAWLAGIGMSGATALAALTLLSQSRGAAIAAAVSVIVVLLAVPGRQRRAFAMIVLGLGLLVCGGPLLNVYDAAQANNGVPPDEVVRRAARFILLSAVLAGVVWAAGTALHSRASVAWQRHTRRAGQVALAVVGVVAVVLAVASTSRITSTVDEQWTAFTNVAPAEAAAQTPQATSSRLVSGSGNRYDYWRVAWDAFEQEPLRGIGAGNFDRAWYADRTISEDVRQPHSIELQVLSELGLAGAILLALVLGGFAAAIALVHRVARPGTVEASVAVAAVGIPMAWLVHTSADWQHIIPGTTAVALVMLAVLLRQPDRRVAETPSPVKPPKFAAAGRWPAFAAAIAAALVVATIGAALTRQAFADHYRAAAVKAVDSDPEQAIIEADRSLRLNGGAVASYYAKAAAQARLGRGAAAQNTLSDAAAEDPTNPVTWALLGDLATRRGDDAAARRFYRRALRLNPLDPGLRELVNPPKPASN